jgi:hypothetical protein
MHAARAYHTATPLPGGQVLIAGGDDGTTVMATAELYSTLAVPAVLVNPMPGSHLGTGGTVTFAWDAGMGVTATWLAVGTATPGSADLYNMGTYTGTQATVNGIPTDGSTLYVTLYSLINGTWQSTAYAYVAGP